MEAPTCLMGLLCGAVMVLQVESCVGQVGEVEMVA